MPNYRLKNPKITWGAAFANTLSIPYPIDDAMAYSAPRDGYEVVQGASGVEDSWILGHDQYFQGQVRWIPQSDGTSPQGTTQTGWEGATGFRAFLEWARAKNVFKFYPDVADGATFYSCYLVEPMTDPPSNEADQSRALLFRFRTSDQAPVNGY